MEHGTETWKSFLADGRKLVGATPAPGRVVRDERVTPAS